MCFYLLSMLALFKEYLHPALYLLFTHIKNMFLTSREAKRPQAQTPEKLVCCCLLLSLLAHGNWFLCHIHISSILWKQKRKRKKKSACFQSHKHSHGHRWVAFTALCNQHLFPGILSEMEPLLALPSWPSAACNWSLCFTINTYGGKFTLIPQGCQVSLGS